MNVKAVVLAPVVLIAFSLALPATLSAAETGAEPPRSDFRQLSRHFVASREYSMEVPHGRVPREVEHPRPRRILSGACPSGGRPRGADLSSPRQCPPRSAQLRGHSEFSQRPVSGRNSFR